MKSDVNTGEINKIAFAAYSVVTQVQQQVLAVSAVLIINS